MLITEQFVVINFPKTGSKFVRSVIKRIHNYDRKDRVLLRLITRCLNFPPPNADLIELRLPIIDRSCFSYHRSPHGLYSQTPPQHRHKQVVSVTRNPFERYVSTYLFRWWKKEWPLCFGSQVTELFPSFPNLTFSEYYSALHHFERQNRLQDINPAADLGLHTIQFIQYYALDPQHVLATIDPDAIQNESYRSELATVTFLHQENLNTELHTFLLSCGYPPSKIDFILQAEKVNVTPRSSKQQATLSFYTPDLIQTILERDRLLFQIFPEYLDQIPSLLDM